MDDKPKQLVVSIRLNEDQFHLMEKFVIDWIGSDGKKVFRDSDSMATKLKYILLSSAKEVYGDED